MLPPANYLALTDNLYTALNNVRAYLFYFGANSMQQIVWSIKINLRYTILTKPIGKKKVIVYFTYRSNFRVFSVQTPLGRPPTSFPTTQTLCKCPITPSH
jgi:hypothetical protein